LLFALLPVAYLGVYFVEYQKPAHHPEPSANPMAVGRVAGEVLSVALGIGVSEAWWAVLAGVIALGVMTLALILPRWKEPRERLSIVGLVAVAAGVTGVAVAIGIGRGGWNSGLWSRYSLLVWPLLATTYLVWAKLGRKWVPIALCLAAALAFPANTAFGMGNGMHVKLKYDAIQAEADAGVSAPAIVSRQFPNSQQSGQEARAVRAIPMLRKARIGIFAK
jgi:hypothetical protein